MHIQWQIVQTLEQSYQRLTCLQLGSIKRLKISLIVVSAFVLCVLGKQLRYMSCLMRKPTICICENKDVDQLRGNREADQRLCFRYTDSTIPLLPKYKIACF